MSPSCKALLQLPLALALDHLGNTGTDRLQEQVPGLSPVKAALGSHSEGVRLCSGDCSLALKGRSSERGLSELEESSAHLSLGRVWV